MGSLIPLHGRTFGHWTVLDRPHARKKKATLWKCRCDCGTERYVEASSLRDGQSEHCGCRSKKLTAGNMSRTPEYHSWNSMNQRCGPKGRYKGITVCERWKGAGGFMNFLKDMGRRPPGTSLDRRDNLRGYSPGNCRWATNLQQNMNRRNSAVVELDGERVAFTKAIAVIRRGLRAGRTYAIASNPREPRDEFPEEPISQRAVPA